MNFVECSIKEEKGRILITHEGFSVYAEKKVLGSLLQGLKKEVILGIRPEDIAIYFEKPKNAAIGAEVYVTEPLGNKTIVDIRMGKDVIKAIASASFSGKPGQKVWLMVKESKLHLFEKETGSCVYHALTGSPLHVAL